MFKEIVMGEFIQHFVSNVEVYLSPTFMVVFLIEFLFHVCIIYNKCIHHCFRLFHNWYTYIMGQISQQTIFVVRNTFKLNKHRSSHSNDYTLECDTRACPRQANATTTQVPPPDAGDRGRLARHSGSLPGIGFRPPTDTRTLSDSGIRLSNTGALSHLLRITRTTCS